MGAANSYISRRLPTRWRDNKVHELQPGALLANSVRKEPVSSPVTTSSSNDNLPAPTPLIPPKPSPRSCEVESPSVSQTVLGFSLPGAIGEEVTMPVVQPRYLTWSLPAFDGPLEEMDVIKRRPKKLPPLPTGSRKKMSALKQLVIRRKLSQLPQLPPLPPIKTVFAEPDPVLQDVEEEDVEFGRYEHCKQSRDGKAVSFDLVFSSQTKGPKPTIQQRPKSSRRKLKKEIKKKFKAADKRKEELQRQEIQRLHNSNAAVMRKLVEHQMKKEAEANWKLEQKKRNIERIRIEHLRRELGPHWYFFGNTESV